MRDKILKYFSIQAILMTLFIVLFYGCNSDESVNIESTYTVTYGNGMAEKTVEYAVEAPPFTEGEFPCTDCHAFFEPNPIRRELEEWHFEISPMFNHDSENRWCLDCHDLNNRDSLRLASGKLLDFKESYKLCGQCHGEKYRDWKVGVHGKRTGNWNGEKEYLLCVHCHNPHSPKFEELTPDPPPFMQENIN